MISPRSGTKPPSRVVRRKPAAAANDTEAFTKKGPSSQEKRDQLVKKASQGAQKISKVIG